MRSQTDDRFASCGKTGTPLTGCSVIDAHGHIGSCAGIAIPDTSLESIVATMDRLGIDLFCVSGFPAVFGQAALGNDMVISAVRRFPDRFFGYMCADVGYPDTIVPELERCLCAGLRAIKIFSYGSRPGLPYDHPNYGSVFEFAGVHRLPVLAHTWGDEVRQLESQFQQHPETTFILAHTGSQETETYIRVAQAYDNVYLETCFSLCPRGLIEHLVSQGLETKVIWGSDAIFMNVAHQLGRVLFAQVSPEIKRAILGKNARRALHLPCV